MSGVLPGDKVKRKSVDAQGAAQEGEMTHPLCDVSMKGRQKGSGRSRVFHSNSRLGGLCWGSGKERRNEMSDFVGWSTEVDDSWL